MAPFRIILSFISSLAYNLIKCRVILDGEPVTEVAEVSLVKRCVLSCLAPNGSLIEIDNDDTAQRGDSMIFFGYTVTHQAD